MKNYMLSNFIDKNCKVMLRDGNTEEGFIRDWDAKYIFIDSGKMTLLPHRLVSKVKEI